MGLSKRKIKVYSCPNNYSKLLTSSYSYDLSTVLCIIEAGARQSPAQLTTNYGIIGSPFQRF